MTALGVVGLHIIVGIHDIVGLHDIVGVLRLELLVALGAVRLRDIVVAPLTFHEDQGCRCLFDNILARFDRHDAFLHQAFDLSVRRIH